MLSLKNVLPCRQRTKVNDQPPAVGGWTNLPRNWRPRHPLRASEWVGVSGGRRWGEGSCRVLGGLARLSLDLSHTITQAVSRHSRWASLVFILLLLSFPTFFVLHVFLCFGPFSVLSNGITQTFSPTLKMNVLPVKQPNALMMDSLASNKVSSLNR